MNLLKTDKMDKTRTLLFIYILLFFSCSPRTEGFKVSMNLKNIADAKVYVNERIPDLKQWYRDSLELKDGQLVYTGKLDYPRLITFTFWQGEENFKGSCSIFLDNSVVEIEGDFKDLKHLTVKGSKTHEEYTAIETQGKKIFKAYRDLGYERGKAFKENRALYDSLSVPYRQAYVNVVKYITTLPGYAHSEVAPYFVYEYISYEDVAQMERALNGFVPQRSANAYITACRNKLEQEKKVQPGQPAFDFTLQDIAGKTYRLSDFRGKYVLLEFSASWCGWCKLEIPFLKTVYEHTQGKDFVMLTVNLDEQKEKWKEDVRQYALPWPVVSDLKAFDSPVAKHYNISGIPMIYLIGPDGLIKEHGLRREQMVHYIDSLFR